MCIVLYGADSVRFFIWVLLPFISFGYLLFSVLYLVCVCVCVWGGGGGGGPHPNDHTKTKKKKSTSYL